MKIIPDHSCTRVQRNIEKSIHKSPPTGKWIKQKWNIDIMQCYSAVEMINY